MFSPVTRNVGCKLDFEKSSEGSSLQAYKGIGNMCLLQPIPGPQINQKAMTLEIMAHPEVVLFVK